MQADMIEAGVDALPDRVDVGLGVWTHRHILRRRLERHMLHGCREVRGAAKLLEEPATQAVDRPELVDESTSRLGIGSPADLELDVLRFARAPRRFELRDRLAVRPRRDEAVARASSELGRTRSARRDVDLRRPLADRVDPRLLASDEAAMEAALAAAEEQAQHVDGFFEHGTPDDERRPASTDDMLVQILPGPHAEEETTIEHHR